MYKMITTGLLCIAAVALKAQDAPIDSVDHTKSNTLGASSTVYTNDLIKYQSATILTGLQGRLKGLNVHLSVACNCYGLMPILNPI